MFKMLHMKKQKPVAPKLPSVNRDKFRLTLGGNEGEPRHLAITIPEIAAAKLGWEYLSRLQVRFDTEEQQISMQLADGKGSLQIRDNQSSLFVHVPVRNYTVFFNGIELAFFKQLECETVRIEGSEAVVKLPLLVNIKELNDEPLDEAAE